MPQLSWALLVSRNGLNWRFPKRYVHLEPMVVTVFEKRGLWRCNQVKDLEMGSSALD